MQAFTRTTPQAARLSASSQALSIRRCNPAGYPNAHMKPRFLTEAGLLTLTLPERYGKIRVRFHEFSNEAEGNL
jgi:hypothetical protein